MVVITPLNSALLCLSLVVAGGLPLRGQIRLERIATGMRQCTDIQAAGDGSGRLFFVRQEGTIWIYRNGQVDSRPFLDIRSRTVGGGERGLLGLAFPPNYREKRWFYLNYTDRSGATVIARYQLLNNDPDLADPASERILLTIPQPFANHNGGQIQFGPDGMLYIGMGDGGGANDPVNAGQDRRTLLGKMLRIDVESNQNRYEIPPDNPFVNDASYRPEIWALGLRNPWRFSFDPATGDLYIADVGQNAQEEVNHQPRSSRGGENYGWVTMEGNRCVRTGCDQTGLTLPVHIYPRSEGVSITGGYVWQGAYYFGDFGSGRIWALRRQAGQWIHELVFDGRGALPISTFGLGEDGALLLANHSSGEIFRAVAQDRPAFSAANVVNAASFGPTLAPGALMTVFTRHALSQNGIFAANSLPLPRLLGGVEVRINGVAAPLLAAVRNGDAEQINFQIPWELQPGSRARMEVVSGAARSEAVEIPVEPVSPGVFGRNASDALILQASDFALTSGPLRRNEPYILYATGLGPLDAAVATGAALSQPSRLRRSASLRVGGVLCDLDYAGAAPGFVGVYQINFRLPAGVPSGSQDLVLSVDQVDAVARKVTVAN